MTNHLLIVEDDEVTRLRIATYFESENYRVSQSEDGDNIHRLVAESTIDVVLLDNMECARTLVTAKMAKIFTNRIAAVFVFDCPRVAVMVLFDCICL